jgi:hypothetical protein
MKKVRIIITLILLLTTVVGYSQKSFPEGVYSSTCSDIIIRNDSVISENVSYFVYYFNYEEDFSNGISTITYRSEDKSKILQVTVKGSVGRRLVLYTENYVEKCFNVSFK